MSISQPITSDKLNSPDHSLSHRVFANDTAAPVKSIVVDSNGRVGIGVETPTEELSFTGESAQTIWMERETTANTAGNNFTIQSGGATVGATNKNAGTVTISTGASTGTGSGTMNFNVALFGASGTGDNTPTTFFSLHGAGGTQQYRAYFNPTITRAGIQDAVRITPVYGITARLSYRFPKLLFG